MRFLFFGLISAAALVSWTNLRAQLPQATLNWIYPPGGQAGSKTEFMVSGADLDDPAGLLFSDERIVARPKPGSPAHFEVTIPADVPEQVLDVRFIGRFGVSNPRAFAVGARAELTVPATNTTATNAVFLPAESTVNGRVNANAFAWFRFTAQAQQSFTVQVEARGLDSRLIPNMIVMDDNGRELAVARRRESLNFTPLTDGDYLLKLSDHLFRGGDEYFFRLTLTTGPRLEFAVPAVLRSGVTNIVKLYGRNLPGSRTSPIRGSDGAQLEESIVEIFAAEDPTSEIVPTRKPASCALNAQIVQWRLNTGHGRSNPLFLPVTANAVANAAPKGLTRVTLPCEFSDHFPLKGELSGVTFEAQKGDVFWLELTSDRLGFPTDPHAVVQRVGSDEQGQASYADVLELNDSDSNFGDREFNTTTRDAAARFEAPETGTYRVLVRDLFNLGEDRPRYPYWLSLHRESPDFRLVVFPMPPPRTGEDRRVHAVSPSVRRDQTLAFKAVLFRRDGFDGDVVLTNTSANLKVAPTRIGAGQNVGTVLITAPPDGVTLRNDVLRGRAEIGTNTILRPAIFASVLWPVADFNNENATARVHREATLSVINSEFTPITIKPAIGNVEVAESSKITIPISITRQGDFQAGFNLKPVGHAALEKTKDLAVPEKATNVTAELNLAESKLPPGKHTLWFQGTATGKYRNYPEGILLAEAELQVAEKLLASVSDSEKAKAEERKKTAEAARKAAEERAKPRDVTFPVYSEPFVVTVLPAQSEEKK